MTQMSATLDGTQICDSNITEHSTVNHIQSQLQCD
jgi:hypothetical protein